MKKTATSCEIAPWGVTIDGDPFPWALAEGPSVKAAYKINQPTIVTLSFPVDGTVEVFNDEGERL